MSIGFQAVQWSRAKLVYDAILLAGVALFITIFIAISDWIEAPKDLPAAIDVRIRAFGVCAFLMLTIILAIGPLARLQPWFNKLLFNRRHFGVLTFLVALLHVWFMIDWYQVQGTLPDLLNELTSWADYGKFIGFPFKVLGLAALVLLFLLAATSHDFWLAFLTPPVWKWLHMSLYAAYGLVMMHVALGIMQYDRNILIPTMLLFCFIMVSALHLVAGWRERVADRGGAAFGDSGWIAVGEPSTIPDKRAIIVAAPGGERIAVFRDGTQVAALTNVCAHQNGPIGEGRVVDGCVTCPWHGWEYRLSDGCAPPPFTEKLATYPVRIRNGIVEVSTSALPAGTPASLAVSLAANPSDSG
jgi:nitrite reductase/ring-hydroxylating ferredoxin subunit/DMSO/TMAO reductase YedYZ heme-binding membrane subunit